MRATTTEAAYRKLWACIFCYSFYGSDIRPMPENGPVMIDTALAARSPRDVEVLRYRFGLVDGFEHTYQETAAVTRNARDPTQFITRERVRQIEVATLRRLRHPQSAKFFQES